MGLSKSEVHCTANSMAYQAVDAIKEHFKDYPATKPDRDALYEALVSRWVRENLVAACAREVEEWSSVITTHAHTLHDNYPKILAFYNSLDEATAHLHVEKQELQMELKLNTPLILRKWALHEMEAWYTRWLEKLYCARDSNFRAMMAKPSKMDVDMYEASTCLDPARSDDDGSDEDGDDSSSSSDSEEEEGEEETSEEEDSSEEEEDDDDDESVANDPPPKRARRESSPDDDSDAC